LQGRGGPAGAARCRARTNRQSKLTAALKDALGGNCRTVMVANLWPEAANLEECVSTLRFASRVSGRLVGGERRRETTGRRQTT
jgi:hypothetical protein